MFKGELARELRWFKAQALVAQQLKSLLSSVSMLILSFRYMKSHEELKTVTKAI